MASTLQRWPSVHVFICGSVNEGGAVFPVPPHSPSLDPPLQAKHCMTRITSLVMLVPLYASLDISLQSSLKLVTTFSHCSYSSNHVDFLTVAFDAIKLS